jgi:hypothetical protein
MNNMKNGKKIFQKRKPVLLIEEDVSCEKIYIKEKECRM